jgi:hypothetical protein
MDHGAFSLPAVRSSASGPSMTGEHTRTAPEVDGQAGRAFVGAPSGDPHGPPSRTKQPCQRHRRLKAPSTSDPESRWFVRAPVPAPYRAGAPKLSLWGGRYRPQRVKSALAQPCRTLRTSPPELPAPRRPPDVRLHSGCVLGATPAEEPRTAGADARGRQALTDRTS